MRILLVAYEFPPSPSPQSLRWAYLSRELAARGHEVHVLAPELPGDGAGLPRPGNGVFVHRIPAGPMIGLVTRRARLAAGMDALAPEPGVIDEATLRERALRAPQVRLNWKGHLFHWIKAVAGFALFPDIRGEWTRGARRALAERIEALHPDIVVTSHEPANTLELGLLASRAGLPWVADLGDPVLAPYTPWRWRRRAKSLERTVWRTADAVTVTTEATAEMLQHRHGAGRGPCVVLPQGYAGNADRQGASDLFRQDQLELLYTGSFYRFREPGALVEAIVATPGVRLTIASMRVPPEMLALAERHPANLRLLGFLPHTEVLALQRAADVLVNIGNLDPCQIPGKFFEYLGSGRPVLHLGPRGGDHAAELLHRAGAGWVCENDGPAIAAAVAALRDDKAAGRLGAGLARDEAMLARYRWDRVAEACEAVLSAALQARLAAIPANMPAQHRDIGALRH